MNESRCEGKENGGKRSDGEEKRERIKQARRAGNETARRERGDVHSHVFTLDPCMSGHVGQSLRDLCGHFALMGRFHHL